MRRIGTISTLLAPAILLATPSAALAGSDMPYPGDLGQAAATLVIFLLLLWVLGKWAWKPVIAQLQRREENLASKFNDAEKRKVQADELATEYEQQLAEIQSQADTLFEKSTAQADVKAQAVLDDAHSKARRLVSRAEEEILSAQQAAQRDLQSQTAELAAEVAAVLLETNLTDAQRDALAAQAAVEIAASIHGEEHSA